MKTISQLSSKTNRDVAYKGYLVYYAIPTRFACRKLKTSHKSIEQAFKSNKRLVECRSLIQLMVLIFFMFLVLFLFPKSRL